LLTLLQRQALSIVHPGDTLVPADDFAIYYLLASEIARMAVSDVGEEVYLFVDAQTAVQVDAVDGARTAARSVFVFGPCPESWATSKSLVVCPWNQAPENRDLFLAALSPRFSLALVCEQGANTFRGAWTGQRSHVIHLARTLLETSGVEPPPGLAPHLEAGQSDDYPLACSMHMMAVLTRQLALRQRDIAMDKDDLSSVLNILKAVSARRRAHDILYVFVEQVARAVTIDRCSVVRVWGGDNVGHVLASHEDETVTDLPIDLGKYPEIRRAMETRQKVIINDTRHDPLMRPFLNELTQSGIASVVVIPVVLFDQNVGSFLLRAARTRGPFLLREISFCEIVAEAAANALERAHLFESIQRANERLEYLAVTDGLTGLYNHRYFRERLESEFDRARRYSLPLSCMIMDIDNFKKINDTYGHLQGDGILRSIAATTLQNVRKSDIVARYGGEEFVVIMPQTGIDGARAQANRVRNDVGGAAYNGMPEGRHVTVSIGVAVFDAATMFDCEALIRAADSALYRAKREGKNRVVVDQPGGNAT